MAFSNPVTGAQGVLVRPAIKSLDYVPGVSGWTINRDGSAEFNNLTIRGVFNGTDYILNANGAFFYNGTPAAGNLIASIASNFGNDDFGNVYSIGLMAYRLLAGAQVSFIEMVNDNIIIGGITAGALNYAGAMSMGSENGSKGFITSGLTNDVTKTIMSMLALFSGAPAVITGNAKVPHVDVWDESTSSQVDLRVSGSVVGIDLSGNPLVWQAPAYNTNWLTSTTFNASSTNQAFHFRHGTADDGVFEGCFKAGGTAPGAVLCSTLPLKPLANRWIHAYRNNGGVITPFGIQWTTGGNVNIVSTMGGGIAAGNEYYIPAQSVPLGNVP